MMLTEEECEKALKNIALSYDAEYVNECNDEFCQAMKNYIKILENLIEEHFSNPPLKFDELNKGYPIYDNDEIVCGWKFIYMIDKEYKQLLLIDEEGNVNWVNYEENRFYRKEVVQE